ncbi:TadE/TadG family type IV pilus assembly protein [Pseudooceanicola sp. MF1-13]|uniref:TadE/TadG family type IV pilus assembly protein n=1 Tax=Pseudooceanicola sp. MF1-13 TaxID=3379095 RepID=UPI0038913237
MKRLLHRFRTSEEGSATIETLIWLPVFIWVLVMIINVSFILFEKNQAFRIVQDANRVLSTGYMLTTAETEAYIASRLADIAPDAVVATSINDGIVTSNVSYQVSQVFMPNIVAGMVNTQVSISAQHFMEY